MTAASGKGTAKKKKAKKPVTSIPRSALLEQDVDDALVEIPESKSNGPSPTSATVPAITWTPPSSPTSARS